MRNIDRTPRPHLFLLPTETAIHRRCGACSWSIHRPAALEAELDLATHWVQDHATAADRERIAAATQAWQEEFAQIGSDLPAHLLPTIVFGNIAALTSTNSGVAA